MGKIPKYTDLNWALEVIEFSESKEFLRLNARIIAHYFSIADGDNEDKNCSSEDFSFMENYSRNVDKANKIIQYYFANKKIQDIDESYILKILKKDGIQPSKQSISLKKEQIKLHRLKNKIRDYVKENTKCPS